MEIFPQIRGIHASDWGISVQIWRILALELKFQKKHIYENGEFLRVFRVLEEPIWQHCLPATLSMKWILRVRENRDGFSPSTSRFWNPLPSVFLASLNLPSCFVFVLFFFFFFPLAVKLIGPRTGCQFFKRCQFFRHTPP